MILITFNLSCHSYSEFIPDHSRFLLKMEDQKSWNVTRNGTHLITSLLLQNDEPLIVLLLGYHMSFSMLPAMIINIIWIQFSFLHVSYFNLTQVIINKNELWVFYMQVHCMFCITQMNKKNSTKTLIPWSKIIHLKPMWSVSSYC